jgi:integrase
MRYAKLEAEYLECKRTSLKETSYKSIETRLRIYVRPFFARERLPIKPRRVIAFKAYLKGLDMKESYRREIFTNMACLLNYGYRTYGIDNPTRKIGNFKRPPRERRRTYTEAEYRLFRQSVGDEAHKVLFDLLYYGGLRRGEAMALTPSDLSGSAVQVTKTYTARKITDPKTAASERSVELPKSVAQELKAMAARTRPGERIFEGTSYSTVKRRLAKAARAAGLPEIRVHDMRHSHITNMLYDGFTPQGIARRVGHSNVETLLNVYAETKDGEQSKMAERMEREIRKSNCKKIPFQIAGGGKSNCGAGDGKQARAKAR